MKKILFVVFCTCSLIMLQACSSTKSKQSVSNNSLREDDIVLKMDKNPMSKRHRVLKIADNHKKNKVHTKKKTKKTHRRYKYSYRVRGKRYKVLANAKNFTQLGTASWYGKGFHRKKTANGERFNMYALTAAHKILPLGSKVLVTNLANGKEVVLRINDRGPFHSNRVIDVSKKAAQKLGFIGRGKTKVKIRVIQ